MTIGFVTWTEPNLSIADEIAIADQVRAHGTSPWTDKLLSNQSGQMIWMVIVLTIVVIISAIINPEVIMPVVVTMGCAMGFYFISVAYAAWKQVRWLRRLEKKHPAGSKPPMRKAMSCPVCDGRGTKAMPLKQEGGVVMKNCPYCHGTGKL